MFCKHCGRNLTEEDLFCPECGQPTEGTVQVHAKPAGSDTMLTIASVMLALFASFAILFGLLFLVMGDTIVRMIEDNPSQFEAFGVTVEQMKALLPLITVVFLGSGVTAGLSAYFVITRTRFALAFLLALIASGIMLITMDILALGIGLLVSFMVYKSRGHFVS